MGYDCSIIENISDLSILKDHKPAADDSILNATDGSRSYYLQGNSSMVIVQNQTDPLRTLWATNAYAVLETAQQMWPSRDIFDRFQGSSPNALFTETASCYFNKNESPTGDYPGINQQRIFETLLWQKVLNTSYGDGAPPQYNFSIDHNITELYGAYDDLDLEYNIPANFTDTCPHQPMTATGVQCKSSSSVGTADIEGVHSTYSNFARTDTPINTQRYRRADRFGAKTLTSMNPGRSTDDEWFSNFFTSTAAPPLFYAPYSDDPDSVDEGVGYMLKDGYPQASQLRQSMLRAHAAYAVQLMYNGRQGFTARDDNHVILLNPNITCFNAGTVIKQGIIPAGVLVALFFL
ncbi:uncharacterized protein EKO05_0000643 [Ascochyta rabiei]|uniref:uncharacterized protein n=1 Tax=Didymella rabiei TaxID=5454 RepID=UPI001901C441|nr:uncharacterized protein EKO05_0000643 [Ascochyta rabiei]UPX09967.1 hypothetical protein EKO05_0000643 [Ascochyta rabiei]